MNLDEQILLLANGYHTQFLDFLMTAFTGRLIWVPFYLACFAGLVYKYGWSKAFVMLAVIGCAVAAADQVCSHMLRPMFERLRPSNLENPFSQYITVVNGYRGGAYGFPSCHASNCFALVGALSVFTLSRRFTAILTVWALLLCFTRMYLGVHYPSDLLVGALVGGTIGASFAMICRSLAPNIKKIQTKHRVCTLYASSAVNNIINHYPDTCDNTCGHSAAHTPDMHNGVDNNLIHERTVITLSAAIHP